MKTVNAFIKRHPVLTYYALTFTISWGGILVLIAPGGIRPTDDHVTKLLPFVLLALFAGPSVASMVLTGLVAGRAGYRDLFARMTKWRVDARWYGLALLLAPLAVSALLLGLSLRSPEFLPRIVTTSDKATLVLFGVAWGLIGGGFLEELGWTGFAVPALRRRYGILTTGLLVGFLWGVWHYLVAFWTISGTASEAISLGIFLPALVFYVASLPAYRVLMVWVYDRTGGSMLVAMLMHAVFSASKLIFDPLGLAVATGLTYEVSLGVVLWGIVGAIALANHGHLSRPQLQTRVA
jgi:uncharacterized protein